MWGTLFALAAISFAAYEYVVRHWGGGPRNFGPVLLAHLVGWGVWAVLTPALLIPLARRFPLDDGRTVTRDLAVHLLAAVVIATLQTLIIVSVSAYLMYGFSPAAMRDMMRDRMRVSFAMSLMAYAIIMAILRARATARVAREQELAAAALEARAARAELAALYAQLQPHFLFNSLNGIAELVHSDPERAARMTRVLSDLLRRALTAASEQTTTLEAEVAFVRRYIELQQMRFARLAFTLRADEQAMAVPVPALLLQPLVENAIRHTVGVRGAGEVSVDIDRVGDRLRLVVRDDGAGFGAESDSPGTGIGLANTRARLDRLYGERYSLEIDDSARGRTAVAIMLPLTVPV